MKEIIKEINGKWKSMFSIKIERQGEDCIIYLREKISYPRLIVIYKSENSYSLKSFEIRVINYEKEEFKELYSVKNIDNEQDLIKELKSVIYGKDLIQSLYSRFGKIIDGDDKKND